MRISILGAAGSGKSTHAKFVGEYLHIPFVDVGGLIRTSCQIITDENKYACEEMLKGNMVPNEYAGKLLRARLAMPDCAAGFVLDGYPRNIEQLDDYDPNLDLVVFLNIPDDLAAERLLSRGRIDDTKEAILRRLHLFHERTSKVLEHYRSLGILVTVEPKAAIDLVKNQIQTILKSKSF